MLEIKYQNILDETLKMIDLVIIDFYAEWCSPCKFLSKELEKLENAHPEYTIVKINVEEENLKKFIEDNEISSLPTLKVYYKQKEIYKRIGYSQNIINEINQKINLIIK